MKAIRRNIIDRNDIQLHDIFKWNRLFSRGSIDGKS